MDTLSIILAIVAVAIAYYFYIVKKYTYFKKHEVPYVPPVPIVGNITPMILRKCNIIEFLQNIYYCNTKAKYVGFFEFSTPIIMIRDSELVKSITVKNFEHFRDHRPFFSRELDPLLGNILFSLCGDKWKDTRNLLSPTFTSSKIKGMFQLMSNCAVHFTQYLSQNEQDLELKAELSKYTNDVIASCAFGIEVDTLKDPKNALYVNGRIATNFNSLKQSIKIFLQRSLPTLSNLLGLKLIPDDVAKFFEDIISSTLKSRESGEIYRPDMIQLLIEARSKKETGKGLTDLEIISNIFGFFFGGFDSVATQSAIIAYLLAHHPEVQEKLQAEVDEVMDKTEGNLTYDVVHGMEYLDAVLNEGMRLYPLAAFLDRLCEKSFELPPSLPGAKPYTVKPGDNLWIPVAAFHRDPDYFENPDKFDPERFVNDSKKIINSGMFIPFGVGPRMCIGNRFALAKMKILLCHLVARCDIKCCSETKKPLALAKGTFAVSSESGYWVRLEARKNPSQYVH